MTCHHKDIPGKGPSPALIPWKGYLQCFLQENGRRKDGFGKMENMINFHFFWRRMTTWIKKAIRCWHTLNMPVFFLIGHQLTKIGQKLKSIIDELEKWGSCTTRASSQ